MKIEKHAKRDHGLWLGTSRGQIHLQFLGDSIVRVRYTREKAFSDKPSLMLQTTPPSPADMPVQQTEDMLVVSSPELTLEIDRRTSSFTWRDAAGRLLTRQPRREGMTLAPVEVKQAILEDVHAKEGVDGVRVKARQVGWRTLRTAWQAKLRFEFQQDEALYGLGQHDQGVFNYRGQQEYLFQQNTKVAMPMLLSTRGWAVLLDSYSLGSFHDDCHGSYLWSDVEDELEFFFMHGPSFDDLIGHCRRLTGKAVMLPRWALGYVQSKERYKTQQELIDIVAEYRKRSLPLDLIVQDWHTWPDEMWGEKQFEAARFPDPRQMVDDLHAMNAKLMVSIWPVMRGGSNAKEMEELGHMMGATPAGHASVYDAFDPEARKVYWRQAYEGYFKYGIDAWWCDCTEPFEADWKGEVKPEPWRQMLIDTEEFKKYMNPEYINAYSLLHSKGLYENQLDTAPDRRMVNLTRSAYIGQQRYGTITWSGDVAARWDVLASQIPAGLNFCMTGCPWWTNDIGGFFVRNSDDFWFWHGDYDQGVDDLGYRELYVRWFQYGTFLPMFRSHGTDTPREVWRFGEPGEIFHDTLVRFLHLRYRLLPYLYSLAGWTYHRDYTPMRALAFDYPAETAVHDIKHQFMFGPALLACPVTRPMHYESESRPLPENPHTRPVYLPGNTSWYDFWTGQKHAAAQTIEAAAPLTIMPLLVKAGAILPLGPVVQYSDQALDTPWELRVYPGADGQFDIYEDAGDGLDYQYGQCSFIPVAWNDQAQTLTFGHRFGSFKGMVKKRVFRIVIVGAGLDEQPGREIEYSGEPLTVELDLATNNGMARLPGGEGSPAAR